MRSLVIEEMGLFPRGEGCLDVRHIGRLAVRTADRARNRWSLKLRYYVWICIVKAHHTTVDFTTSPLRQCSAWKTSSEDLLT